MRDWKLLVMASVFLSCMTITALPALAHGYGAIQDQETDTASLVRLATQPDQFPSIDQSATGEMSALSIEELKPKNAPGERVGYKRKRFVGGPLEVIPEAVMQSQVEAEGVLESADSMRAFVVLGPGGYSWRFMYDRKLGVPKFEHVLADDPRQESVEVTAPDNLAFEAGEVSLKNSLICTNRGTCRVCHCCMICYCGAGGYCDTDWTGFYESVTRLEERHTVYLLPKE